MRQTDQALILRMAAGDPAACRALYARWAPYIRAYAVQRLWWRPCDDDDVVQEVMLRVWRAAPRYIPGDNDGRRWVWRIVRNLIRDWAATNECSVRYYARLAALRQTTSMPPNTDLEDADAAAELWSRLERSGRLTPRQRECLRAASESSGQTLVDVAHAVGLNINTFKGHIWQGRLVARRVLAE